MNPPLVSICIITYNQAKYIAETLASALDQDYENFEIVVADDGSTDGTAQLISELAREHPTKIIPLVGGENLGITGNSNRGLAACNGKYIAFLGGDDLMCRQKVSVQCRYMEANPQCSVSYHDLEVFDDATGKNIFLLSEAHKPYCGDVRGVIKLGTVNGASATMVRRRDVPTHGFCAEFPVASDWFFWIETLMSNDGTIGYVDQILGRYRRHANNVTRRNSSEVTAALRDNFDTCMKILVSHPEYAAEALFRLGVLFRGLRHGPHYHKYLRLSLKFSPNPKAFILLALSYLSLGRVRK